jgi:hypothetical protein
MRVLGSAHPKSPAAAYVDRVRWSERPLPSAEVQPELDLGNRCHPSERE